MGTSESGWYFTRSEKGFSDIEKFRSEDDARRSLRAYSYGTTVELFGPFPSFLDARTAALRISQERVNFWYRQLSRVRDLTDEREVG